MRSIVGFLVQPANHRMQPTAFGAVMCASWGQPSFSFLKAALPESAAADAER
jgi:hypothetical protein